MEKKPGEILSVGKPFLGRKGSLVGPSVGEGLFEEQFLWLENIKVFKLR